MNLVAVSADIINHIVNDAYGEGSGVRGGGNLIGLYRVRRNGQ